MGQTDATARCRQGAAPHVKSTRAPAMPSANICASTCTSWQAGPMVATTLVAARDGSRGRERMFAGDCNRLLLCLLDADSCAGASTSWQAGK